MNHTKKNPWLNVWMLVFAAFGFWLTLGRLIDIATSPGQPWSEYAVASILLLFITGIALWRLPGFKGVEEAPDRGNIVLAEMAGIYLTAWKQLWSQKWLRWFFGIFFLVMFFGGLLENILTHHYLAQLSREWLSGILGPPKHMGTIGFIIQLPDEFTRSLLRALGNFDSFIQIPRVIGTSIIADITFAVIAIIIYSKLKKLYDDPEYSRGAHVLRSIVIPFVIISLTLAAFVLIATIRRYAAMGSGSNPNNVIPNSLSIIFYIGEIVFNLAVNSAIFSGFAGSLARTFRRQTVNLDTFIKDIIEYIKPITLLFVSLLIIQVITSVPTYFIATYQYNNSGMSVPSFATLITGILENLIYIALMFVPFAIICKMQDVKQGIKDGLILLRKNIREVATFIALGLTFLTVVNISRWIPEIIGGPIYASQITSLIAGWYSSFVTVIVMAVMVLAIWNLYLRFETCPGSDDDTEQTEPSPE
ncbi:MAG: hypothetical protein ACYC27_17295 [Armatimonadota bacterium]